MDDDLKCCASFAGADSSSATPIRWVPSEEVGALLRELGADDAWAREIAADRAAVDAVDPWPRNRRRG